METVSIRRGKADILPERQLLRGDVVVSLPGMEFLRLRSCASILSQE